MGVFDDKVALVTGAASGMGYGIALAFAKAVLWLSSEESSFTVGHSLAVDAGYLVR